MEQITPRVLNAYEKINVIIFRSKALSAGASSSLDETHFDNSLALAKTEIKYGVLTHHFVRRKHIGYAHDGQVITELMAVTKE